MILGLFAIFVGCWTPPEDDLAQFAIQFRSPTPYEMVEGDTPARVAQRWGVSEVQVRNWNPEVETASTGDLLYVFVPPGTEPVPLPKATVAKPPRKHARRSRCKAQRTDAAEGEIVAAEGLSQGQIQAVVAKRLPRTLSCLPAGLNGEYQMIVEITVGCDGRVTNTYTVGAGALSPSTTRCVEKVFRGARFPAHDMPDGQSFQYPLTFTP